MSEYRTIETEFNDGALLLQALTEICTELGGELDTSLCNDLHLFGWHGQERPETAQYVIRRKLVGRAANDLGFVQKDDGSFGVIISAFDSGADEVGRGLHVLNQVKERYNYLNVTETAFAAGYQVFEDVDDLGQIVLSLVSF